jgi:large subunit ribosomal protein L2
MLAPKGIKILDQVTTYDSLTKNIALSVGDRTLLSNFEPGDFVHAVENEEGKTPVFARAAGTFCQILQHDSKKYVKVRLPSGSQRLIINKAKATLGVLANEEHNLRLIGKAGRSR